jgi:hypothetical protein
MALSSYKHPMVQLKPNEQNKYFTEYTASDDNAGEAVNVKASTILSAGTWLKPVTGGKFDVATPTDEDIVLLIQPVRSTDADLASADLTRTVMFYNDGNHMFRGPVTGGALVAGDENDYFALNATGNGIDYGTKANAPATGKIFRLYTIVEAGGVEGIFYKVK